jgi:hypothetical protein
MTAVYQTAHHVIALSGIDQIALNMPATQSSQASERGCYRHSQR